ncbi:Murein L,D-transpeptidase YcbB/YkuD [Ohtaekwangia koreensis]|uniref:Murein L,D-transpeptidase YcbB/YkuD n=2 Tax=Ohtaekwangia koreensis TaxID=688867 RepID=A0A1T5K3H5_9BACT|nr:Murein L,D-transpeptidase YcbB/YkuD [Ohtaekwangia koreensis]
MDPFCRHKCSVNPHSTQFTADKKSNEVGTVFSNLEVIRTTMRNKMYKKVYGFGVSALCVSIFFSCSKNITPVDTAKNKVQQETIAAADSLETEKVVRAGRSLSIDTLQHPLDSRKTEVWKRDADYNLKVHDKVVRFYALNDYRTKWLGEYAPNSFYQKFTELVANSVSYGLVPEDYTITGIEEKLNDLYTKQPLDTAAITALDIQISERFFLLTTHMMDGKIRYPGNGAAIWIRDTKQNDRTSDVFALAETIEPEQLTASITKLQPAYEQYQKLQKALEHYRTLEKSEPVALTLNTSVGKIKPEDKNLIIPLIRRKLALTDLKVYAMPVDSVSGKMDSLRYDAELVSAIKWFQFRHGLEPDGIIGEKTLKFLNQTFKEKANIIALNMERLRWLPKDKYNDNYIMVNIPEYKLRMIENQKEVFNMRVIVGAPGKPTPVFNDAVNHIIFSPTWTVPTSIIKEEIIPRLRKDSSYYTQKNYAFFKNEETIDPAVESWKDEEINPYKYRIVQQPGPDNSLGLVKFGMPNKMNIYLHDTPNHSLFNKTYRALSHGCVRLDEPALFAEYLLRDQKGWNKATVQNAMKAGTPTTIHLRKRYPVHIEYHTAWVDENGLINFREDIYGHDRRQLEQLYPTDKASAVAGI